MYQLVSKYIYACWPLGRQSLICYQTQCLQDLEIFGWSWWYVEYIMNMVLMFANRSLEPLVGCSEAARRRGVALWSRWGAPCNSRHIHQLPALLQKWWRVAKMQRCCCMYLHVFACTQIYRIQYMQWNVMWRRDGKESNCSNILLFHRYWGNL